VREGKSPGYRLTSPHPSKTAKGAAASVVVAIAKIEGEPAPISARHALAIVNRGGATAADVLAL
jgi:UDP-N-acetylenolpyruvoylglucosamine reductase